MAQISFIKPNTKIKFFEHHKPVMFTMFTVCILGLLYLCVAHFANLPGVNWGTSFEGGTSITLHFEPQQNAENNVSQEDVRAAFVNDPRFESVTIQTLGKGEVNQYVVRTRTTTSMSCENLAIVKSKFNDKLALVNPGKTLTLNEATWPSCDGDGIRGDFDIGLVDAEKLEAFDLDAEIVAKAITDAGYSNVTVAKNELRNQYTIKPQGIQADAVQLLTSTFGAKFNPNDGIDSVSSVGADVGEKFRNDAIVSILIALGMMLLYIAFRFDSRYAPAAVISLATTTVITFVFIIVCQIEFTLETVAALLSLVGYGINDTIVNFDRVRENIALCEKDTELKTIVNKAINECISRTVITSITTLLAIGPLIFIANGTTRDFAIIMFVGICIATLNSMFISCPLLVKFDEIFKNHKKAAEAKKVLEADIIADAEVIQG